MREFRVDDYGAPPYPELVLCVTRADAGDERPLVAATVRALRRGYEETINDPERRSRRWSSATRPARPPPAQLDAVSPAFTEGVTRTASCGPTALRAWAAWEARFGITTRPPDVARAFATGF